MKTTFQRFAILILTARTLIASESQLPLLPNRTYDAVIIPKALAVVDRHLSKHFTGFWTPLELDVAKAELKIAVALASASTNAELRDFTRRNALHILGSTTNFVRQYVGIIVNSKKQIFCNAVDKKLLTWIGDETAWRRGFSKWYDAGKNNWTAIYDVEEDKCLTLRVEDGF